MMSKIVDDLRLPPNREEVAIRYVLSGRVVSRNGIAVLRYFPYSLLLIAKPSKAQRAGLGRFDKLTN
ncbi:unnamed protein product [Adineta steineri]|uniref:Uncharacterized protein n=1 Tax=Adineta steineri TaxID=433720 RepID=A0A818LJ75_9BILA|nr:unnamed protein product [Adineta steineri]CAF1092115.1 unnamed protein product [Adineta steineri]CAF3576780.1 unnamed protein product [Adineta steineri]CAF4035375.1 unnamed protein product [Adineta steineri]